jgi:hypothetical protein
MGSCPESAELSGRFATSPRRLAQNNLGCPWAICPPAWDRSRPVAELLGSLLHRDGVRSSFGFTGKARAHGVPNTGFQRAKCHLLKPTDTRATS